MVEAISASMEDYLETIFRIVSKQKVARPKDIVESLGVTGPSVTKALHWLSNHGLINYAPFELISLTEKGTQAAKDVVRRHEALRDFFVQILAVDEKSAEDAACKMEHCISAEILERLIQFSEFVQVCPRVGTTWIKVFSSRYSRGEAPEDCEECVSECLENVRQKKEERAKQGTQTTLRDLHVGEKGRIVKFTGDNRAKRRIVEMGISTGGVIEVERVAPLGDPIDVKIKGYHLSLRKEEAAHILVDPL